MIAAGAVTHECRRGHAIAAFALLLMLAGAGLRLRRYVADRSLWGDEALLALNLAGRPFTQLALPLDHEQVAPLGFLVAEKAALVVLGPGEWALRLVPLLCGLAVLPLFWRFASRLLPASAALFALGLVVVSEPLVYYSNELKQYSCEVLVALLLLLAGERMAREPSSRAAAVFGAAFAGGVWFSYSAVFVALAAGLAATRLADRRGATRVLAATAAGLLSFSLEYVLLLRSSSGSGYLRAFWGDAFAPPPLSMAAFEWYRRTLLGVLSDPLGLELRPLAALLLAAGALGLARGGRRALTLALGPTLLALVASGSGAFPFATNAQWGWLEPGDPMAQPWMGRVILFATPGLYVALASGAGVLGRWGRPGRAVALLAALALLAHPAWRAATAFASPPDVHDARGIVDALRGAARPGDAILVQNLGAGPVDFYRRVRGWSAPMALCGIREPAEEVAFEQAVRRLAAGTRVWLLTVHHPRWGSEGEAARLRSVLARHAREERRIATFRAEAVLFSVPAHASDPAFK